MQEKLHDYVDALLKAASLQAAFSIYQKEVVRLGFDGVLYSIIPKAIMQSNFRVKPVFEVSSDFGGDFMSHYWEAEFYKHDPLIEALQAGIRETLDWNSVLCEQFISLSASTREVMDVARLNGIEQGLTIPLMTDERGVAAATIISRDSHGFSALKRAALADLEMRTSLFHNLVMANPGYSDVFSEPMVGMFNTKQLGYVVGMASGLSTEDIAYSLGTSVGYLEQSMLKLRRKMSGVSEFEPATVNRNQVMYTAGLLNLLRGDVLEELPTLQEKPEKVIKSRKSAANS